MPKMKTNKSIAKRVKVTGRGKITRHKTGSGHLKSKKSPKQIRNFRNDSVVSKGIGKQIKRMLGL